MASPSERSSIRTRALGVAIACAGMILARAACAGEVVKVGGTGAALGTMRMMAETFGRQNPDLKVSVLPSLGTSGAIKAVSQGALQIGLSVRTLTEAEVRLGVTTLEYARTPLVVAVAASSAATSLTLEQLAGIYAGTLLTWPDGGQIRPILRQAGDDNTRQLRQMSPALDRAVTVSEQRQGMPYATTDQEAADMAESIPGALTITALSVIVSEKRPLRPLTLEGLDATVANGASGRYPHHKSFFLVMRTDPSPGVVRFVAFVRSAQGLEILSRTGHWVL